MRAKDLIPEHVTDKLARLEFVRVVNEIGPDNLRAVDISLLVDYAITHGEIIHLRDEIGGQYTLIGAKGGEYTNPRQNILSGLQSHLAQLRRDLYFTPKSRVEKGKPSGKAQSILEALQSQDTTSDDTDED